MADIKIKLGIDAAGLQQGAATAKKAVGDLKRSTATQSTMGVPVGLAAAAAAMAATGIAARGMWAAMEAGGSLVDLSAQTGIAIDKLMILQTAFKQAGLGADAIQPMVSKLQNNIFEAASGSAEAQKKFRAMGVSFSDLRKLTPDQQLMKVGEAINAMNDPAQKTAAAIDVFGKSGAKMLALFSAGGLKDASENLGRQARLMRENAGVFDRTTDVLGTAGSKVQGLFVGMASQVLPQLTDAIEGLNKIDLTGIGESLGDGIGIAIVAMEIAFTKFKKLADFVQEKTKAPWEQIVRGYKHVMGTTEYGIPEKKEKGKSIFQELLEAIEVKRSSTRKKYTTELPETVITAPLMPQKPRDFEFASSMQKVGGSMFGPSLPAENSVLIERQQLEQQRRMTEKLDVTNLLLRSISEKSTSKLSASYG